MSLRLLAPLASGGYGPSIWDQIWSGDAYADPKMRDSRARRRLTSMGLLDSALPAGTRLLDAGCGSGVALELLSCAHDDNLELVGADFSSRAVSLAKTRLAGRASIVQADVTSLPFPNAHFSHLLLFGVLEHIRDDAKALAEIRRVSGLGATVYISTSNYFSVLQLINFIRRNTCGYPYGFQKNWKRSALEERLNEFFTLRSVKYDHADRDMPLVRALDQAATRLCSQWGRYMHIICEKSP